jgi:hypothetical protein
VSEVLRLGHQADSTDGRRGLVRLLNARWPKRMGIDRCAQCGELLGADARVVKRAGDAFHKGCAICLTPRSTGNLGGRGI